MYDINDIYSRLSSLPQQLKAIIRELKFELNKTDIKKLDDIVTIEKNLKWAKENKWIVKLYDNKHLVSCHDCEDVMQIDSCSKEIEDEMRKTISDKLNSDILIKHCDNFLYIKKLDV